jgi:hypothetical protein
MRLLNTSKIKFDEFYGSEIPPYAILSHTWGDGEVSFQDFRDGKGKNRDGHRKITECCRLAASDGWQFVWIDTCCIDKTSSAELSEAINSMFEWYQRAGVCYSYLADVLSSKSDRNATMMQFNTSRWFTRGWTLQELLAPEIVIFYDCNWIDIGTKSSLSKAVSTVTGITELDILDFKKANIAVKMSWASKRKTTRIEDTAYCLMGLFGVNMPLLYGEGRDAFIRLQLEILKMSDDETIFAWEHYTVPRALDSREPNWTGAESGLLAPFPAYFHHSGDLRRILFDKDRPVYSMTNKGLQMGFLLLEQMESVSPSTKFSGKTYLASLNCTRDPEGWPLAIFLRSDPENNDIPNTFTRYTSPDLKLTTMSATNAASILKIQRQTVYIKQTNFQPSRHPSFHFRLTIKYPTSFRVTSELRPYPYDFQDREKLEYRECGITLFGHSSSSGRSSQGILMFDRPHAENSQSFVMFLRISRGLVLTDVASPKGTQTLAETAHLFDQQLHEINRIHRKDSTFTLLQDGSSVSVTVRPKGLVQVWKRFAVDVTIDESGRLPWPPSYMTDEPGQGQEQEATDAGVQT